MFHFSYVLPDRELRDPNGYYETEYDESPDLDRLIYPNPEISKFMKRGMILTARDDDRSLSAVGKVVYPSAKGMPRITVVTPKGTFFEGKRTEAAISSLPKFDDLVDINAEYFRKMLSRAANESKTDFWYLMWNHKDVRPLQYICLLLGIEKAKFTQAVASHMLKLLIDREKDFNKSYGVKTAATMKEVLQELASSNDPERHVGIAHDDYADLSLGKDNPVKNFLVKIYVNQGQRYWKTSGALFPDTIYALATQKDLGNVAIEKSRSAFKKIITYPELMLALMTFQWRDQ